MENKIHHGRNIKRFREMLGIKQEALAIDLGDEWNQKKVSLLEQQDVIDDFLLQKISDILKVPVEAFRSLDSAHATNIISNTFNDFSFIACSFGTYNNNPLTEILKLHEDKIFLYECMLKEKDIKHELEARANMMY